MGMNKRTDYETNESRNEGEKIRNYIHRKKYK